MKQRRYGLAGIPVGHRFVMPNGNDGLKLTSGGFLTSQRGKGQEQHTILLSKTPITAHDTSVEPSDHIRRTEPGFTGKRKVSNGETPGPGGCAMTNCLLMGKNRTGGRDTGQRG